MAGAHLSSYFSWTPVGQWPSPEGLVGADAFLLIDSLLFPALWNLFLMLLPFFPAPLKTSPLFSEVIVFLTWKALQWAKCIIIFSGIKNKAKTNIQKPKNQNKQKTPPMEDEFSPCSATWKLPSSSFPFFPKPRVSLRQGKMELAAPRNYAWSSPGPSCGSDKSIPVHSSLLVLGIWSFRVDWPLGVAYGVEKLSGKGQWILV